MQAMHDDEPSSIGDRRPTSIKFQQSSLFLAIFLSTSATTRGTPVCWTRNFAVDGQKESNITKTRSAGSLKMWGQG